MPAVQVAPLGVALLPEILDLLVSLRLPTGPDLLAVRVPLKPRWWENIRGWGTRRRNQTSNEDATLLARASVRLTSGRGILSRFRALHRGQCDESSTAFRRVPPVMRSRR
jgi:hypothetical protein